MTSGTAIPGTPERGLAHDKWRDRYYVPSDHSLYRIALGHFRHLKGNCARIVLGENGGPVQTRTADLFRVKVSLYKWYLLLFL